MPNRLRIFKSRASKHKIVVAALLLSLLMTTTIIFLVLIMNGAEDDFQSYHIEEVIDIHSRIGRGELRKIRVMPPNITKDEVFKSIGMPLAKLKDLKTPQAGVLQQFAYPLAFDPQTQIVLLFKSDELMAYRFAFNGTIPAPGE